MHHLKNHSGTSLIELMIATALGLWLLGGVLICYHSNQRTFQVEQALAHMQENGRVAIHLLSQDIHSAGYSGCLPLASLELNQLISSTKTINFAAATRIAGWHQLASTSALQLPTEIARNAVSGSDILLIQRMQPDNAVVNAHNKTILLAAKSDYRTGDILLISDCTHADVIQVTAASGKALTITPALLQSYNNTSQIGHLATVVYYIRKTSRKNVAGAPIYGLYRRDINQPSTLAQEIAEGVDNMRLKFGVIHHHKMMYLSIPQLTSADWQAIVSIQIALSLNSINPVSNRTADRLLRQAWDTTIAIREPISLVH